jgi:hypothetical protein
MSRYQYWQYIVDEEGRPLEGVNIRFYLSDDPNTEADIFLSPTLGAPTKSSIADIESDGDGFFEFWVGDEFETVGGYVSSQRFRITWERAGILLGYIDNIDIFPPVFQVDETDNSSLTTDLRNKLISNSLAYEWDAHVNSTYEDQPHDLEPVDYTSEDTTYNKLVNNSMLNYLFSVLSSGGTTSIGVSGAAARYFTVTSWTAYGDYYYTDILHALGNEYPIVQVIEQSTKDKMMPYRIVSINSNTTRIWVSSTFNAEITIIG